MTIAKVKRAKIEPPPVEDDKRNDDWSVAIAEELCRNRALKREAAKIRRTVRQVVRDLILRGLGKDPDAPKAVKP